MDQVRADLHVHSKYSDRPSEWILRRLGSPESFTEPMDVYEGCRKRGMRFVTISDHNRIDGALSISHLPGSFISAEVTTYFPEDGAKLHCLVTGVTEAQFAVINEARENIYDLRRYVLDNDIIFTVAHPLFRVNDKLGPQHIEKLLVMFKRFEAINGTRDPRAADVVDTIFRQVSPAMIEQMADKHGIDVEHAQPHQKWFTGGSDDHGGVYLASAYTVTPEAETVEEYLDHLRNGRHEAGGRSGDSLRLAHSFYHIAHDYYRNRILANPSGKPSILGELFRRLLERPQPAQTTGIGGRARTLIGRFVSNRRKAQLSDVERNLIDEFAVLFSQAGADEVGADHQAPLTEQETFALACRISHQLGYSFLTQFVEHARNGQLIDSLQTVAALGPVAMSISPYLAAMKTQHKDEQFIQDVSSHFEQAHHLKLRSDKRAWLTDTFSDVNGVARTVHHLAPIARKTGRDLTVVTCLDDPPAVDFNYRNFKPVGTFTVPEYDQQALAAVPFLEMIEYLESGRFSELILSTPGPVGLTGLAAGKLLGLKLVGIYHTDFPRYVQMLTEDDMLEQMTWKYMIWFYDQMDLILVPSRAYMRQLADVGIDPNKMRVLGRGVDLQQFDATKRNHDFWPQRGLDDGVTFLYVGRVSEEKNLPRLLEDYTRLPIGESAPTPTRLAIVGDGPALKELRKKYKRPDILFTGTLTGEELSQAYASADCFVFPSTTDTFGNVILEAQASGLPCIVTDRGGPAELIENGYTGLVIDPDRPGAFASAISELAADPQRRAAMGRAAREAASAHAWESAFDIFWQRDDEKPAPPKARGLPSPGRPLADKVH